MLNEAAAMAVVNLGNHVASNSFLRTLRWIRLQLCDHAYFADLPSKLLRRFLCKAVTTNENSVWELLSDFPSLAHLPADGVWMVFLSVTCAC